MTDNWGRGRAEPVAVGPPRRRMSRSDRLREARGQRKRRMGRGFVLAMLIVVVIGAVFLGSKLWHTMSGGDTDFSGDGVNDVVIQIHDGDSTTAIGKTLEEHKVVATVAAFVGAAQGNAAISSIQPGFYKVRTEIPASNAVARLADPQNRVGKLVIPEGRQLDDIQDVKTNAITDGIFSLISQATCVNLDGDRHCVSINDLKKSAGSAAPSALSVPDWAMNAVAALGNDHRRLEGLIAPGTWNIDPSAAPQDILATLIGASATQYAQGGLLDTAKAMNMSPYQILTVGSLVQRESKPDDFTKVARVIYNRLAENRTSGVRLHGELPTGSHRGGDHGRRPRPAHAVEHLCAAGTSGHPDLLTRSAGTCRGRTACAGGLAVLRHHRSAGHDVVHPRLRPAPREHRTGQT